MKRSIVFLAVLFAALPALAAPRSISITDLQVNSDNPKYRYLGKGIAELIAWELAKSKDIAIVEREKRTEMMKELEVSQTGLVDADAQLKLGKMLAAKFIVFGDIIDMGDAMVVSLRMIDTETGQTVWREKITEQLTKYDYISGFFAVAILKQVNARAAVSTEQKVAVKKEKDEKAAVAFAQAMDSYDKNNDAAAKSELETAKDLDPENELVDIYLAKLSVTSPKFRAELEVYSPTENPALLGFIKQDKIYFLYAGNSPQKIGSQNLDNVGDGYEVEEKFVSGRLGYAFPLVDGAGLSVEFIQAVGSGKVDAPVPFDNFGTPDDYVQWNPNNIGMNIGAGYRISPVVSIGGAFHLFHTDDDSDPDPSNPQDDREIRNVLKDKWNVAWDLGLALSIFDGNLLIDSHVTTTTQKTFYLDQDAMSMKKGNAPVVIDTTITGALLNRKLFLVGKGIYDFYTDDTGLTVFRGIPLAEYWAFSFLSLRGGYEFTSISGDGVSSTGGGIVAGATLRLWEFDIDFNMARRHRPVRVLPGYSIDENRYIFGITKNATFFD